MKIGIVGAMKEELRIIVERLDNVREERIAGIDFFVGSINGNLVVAALTGVGKVNASCAAVIMISDFEVDLVINTGIAGGLPGTNTKDVIIASGLAWHDFDIRIFGYEYSQVPGFPKVMPVNPNVIMNVKSVLNKLNIQYKEGIIVSGDQFVTSMSMLEMVKDLNPLACEMEGCAVAQACVKAGVDFLVLRYISDIVGAENQNNDYLTFETEMANRSSRICISLLENLL